MEIRASDLRGRAVVMAVSGGLDSCTITHWLARQGVEVIAYTADLGQPDEDEVEDVRERMLACGAKEAILDDLKPEIATAGLQLIQASARYEGGYWNTTAIARHVVVAAMVPVLRQRGVSILGHGCTGRGNDQVRFELAAQMLDPAIGVYAPWRDHAFLQEFGGRRQMIDYCGDHGLPVRATHDSPYSTDANMLGLTHEAGELEDLATPACRIDPGMGRFPVDAPDEPQTVDIHFEKGVPVKLDKRKVSPVEAIETCNEIAGRHGVGIGLHTVENRFVGIKSRGSVRGARHGTPWPQFRVPAAVDPRPPLQAIVRSDIVPHRRTDLPGIRVRHRDPGLLGFRKAAEPHGHRNHFLDTLQGERVLSGGRGCAAQPVRRRHLLHGGNR